MTPEEQRRYARDGYIVRAAVFGAEELRELRAVVEETVAAIQWEWDEGSREIRLVEPCDHLHPRLAALFRDARFTKPMRDALGCDEVALFTTKLNLNRPREGSEFPYHQGSPTPAGSRNARAGRREPGSPASVPHSMALAASGTTCRRSCGRCCAPGAETPARSARHRLDCRP